MVRKTLRRSAVSIASALLMTVGGVAIVGAGTAVAARAIGSGDIQKGAVKSWHIEDQSLGGWDFRKDSIGEGKLRPQLRDKINAPAGLPAGAWYTDEDGSTVLARGVKQQVGHLNTGPGIHVVSANVTVSAAGTNGNMLCYLNANDQDVAVGNAKGSRESFALTAMVEAESVFLDCMVDTAGGGSATDISITSVQVATD